MKKLTAILILCISLLGFFPKEAQATSTGSFVVTAYYSPLPNQSAYIMGSYEAEIRMNGEWIRWASGKPVFAWMLAAPQTYSFGTKIYLAGIGIWEVADRWGAIVPKWQRGFQHDRIDVWMGYGEEGLRRAMYWGNRTVKGYITHRDAASTIKLTNHPAPIWATSGLRKITTSSSASPNVSNIYSLGIGSHSNKEIVIQLQKILKNNNFYSWELDWDYSSIESIVYSYQFENWLVFHPSNLWAGYWWAITRSLFLKQYQAGTLIPPEIILEEEVEIEEEIVIEIPSYQDEDIFSETLTTSEEFKKLQSVLQELWLYEGEIDGEYDSVREIIFNYQLDKELVINEGSVWAGVYGPNTRATLKKDYEEFTNKQKQETEDKIRLEEEKIELEARKLELEILDKEKSIATQERKTELVEQFIRLEKIAGDEAKNRIENIWLLEEWDVSASVRELQVILKEIGYLEAKDTAIYGRQTKESIFEYQLDRGLISSLSDTGAWIFWPVTKDQINKDLQASELEKLLFENEISLEELIEHGIKIY